MADYRKIRNLSARMDCGCNPGIITLHKSQQVKNADNTGDDNPVVCNAWIDYWKTFTMEDIPDVCPLCGEPMTDDDSKGCHVLITDAKVIYYIGTAIRANCDLRLKSCYSISKMNGILKRRGLSLKTR